MASSTVSSNSGLTNNIWVTQNTGVASTYIKKECTYIEIEDSGIFSEYNEMNSKSKLEHSLLH